MEIRERIQEMRHGDHPWKNDSELQWCNMRKAWNGRQPFRGGETECSWQMIGESTGNDRKARITRLWTIRIKHNLSFVCDINAGHHSSAHSRTHNHGPRMTISTRISSLFPAMSPSPLCNEFPAFQKRPHRNIRPRIHLPRRSPGRLKTRFGTFMISTLYEFISHTKWNQSTSSNPTEIPDDWRVSPRQTEPVPQFQRPQRPPPPG
jgi:hypothetical protein